MKNFIKLGTLSLVASALLVGCGSSSSSSSSDELLTGYFIDAPVTNCEYRTTSGQTGKTENGIFKYRNGDKVKFYLGGLSLGEAAPEADGLITPETLAANDENVKITLLRLLQALDSDNNPSNGITISEDILTSLKNLTTDVDISTLKSDEDIAKIDDKLWDALDEDYDGKIDVSKEIATTHFETSLNMWENGEKPTNNNGQNNGNGNGYGYGQGHEDGQGGGTFDLTTLPVTSELSLEVKEALAYMGNEERLAYDTYMTLYNYHNDAGTAINQLTNIASRSEIRHVGIVQDLVKRYDINISELTGVSNPVANKDVAFEDMPTGQYDIEAIQNLYNALIAKGKESQQAALEVGCMVEVTDIDDLDKYIVQAKEINATDVVEAFNVLRDGSYNHYWAFDKGLKNIGVSEGCAAAGEEYAKTADEYPQNQHGNDINR
jgi:hypothetical protein